MRKRKNWSIDRTGCCGLINVKLKEASSVCVKEI